MATFNDSTGRAWEITLDVFIMERVKAETEIDLADMTGNSLATIEHDACSLGKVLTSLCRDDFAAANIANDRDFAKRLNGPALKEAFAAVLGAVADFFQPAIWSEVQPLFEAAQRTVAATAKANTAAPLFEVWKTLPPEVRKALATEEGMSDSTLRRLEELTCASGQDATLPANASNSPENAGLSPAV